MRHFSMTGNATAHNVILYGTCVCSTKNVLHLFEYYVKPLQIQHYLASETGQPRCLNAELSICNSERTHGPTYRNVYTILLK